jgi:hypothetical protein
MIDFFKWLLQVDIRWKNGLSALVSLVFVAIFYFEARHSEWFREVAARGNGAILFSLAMVLLISFLALSLILSAVVGLVMHRRLAKKAMLLEIDKLQSIRNTLHAMTTWQRGFLLRFIVNNTTQINEWDAGGYEAVWGPELNVLIAKGVIKRYPGGVLEIAPQYRRFLQAFWDPATGKLKEI